MAKQTTTMLALLAATILFTTTAFTTSNTRCTTRLFSVRRNNNEQLSFIRLSSSSSDESSSTTTTTAAPPVLNGKMVLPLKVIMGGLKDHKVAAVYAVLNSNYKRGNDGWQHAEFVSSTTDLQESLQALAQDQDKDTVAHVRALSFSFPQVDAMNQVADDWRKLVEDAGGNVKDWNIEEELEDDDDDEDWLMETQPPPTSIDDNPEGIISPFASGASVESSNESADGEALAFTRENVDKVLDEVRPYLVRDGGNVAVDSVDSETKNVYLILEGACGSCSSSTVTMQMGIERVLKENFENLGEVIEIEDPNAPPPATELTWNAVEEEVNRIKPAIIAMGGTVEIRSVEPTGQVQLEFEGGEKLKQGLELAVKDVEFVTEVTFI